MEQKILSVLPRNWNVFVINGNAAPVTTFLRKQIQKLNPSLNRTRRGKPMVVRGNQKLCHLETFTKGVYCFETVTSMM